MTFLQLILLYFSALVGGCKYHPGIRNGVRRIKKPASQRSLNHWRVTLPKLIKGA